jgi:twinkle protein
VVPDRNGDIIVIPYFEKGVIVAEKYRTPGKRFWQRPNGRPRSGTRMC